MEKHNVETRPDVVDAPNAITEYVEIFSLLGSGTPTGLTIHIQLARDIVELADPSGPVNASNVKIVRRRFANITMPAVTAESMAKAILETIEIQKGQQ